MIVSAGSFAGGTMSESPEGEVKREDPPVADGVKHGIGDMERRLPMSLSAINCYVTRL